MTAVQPTVTPNGRRLKHGRELDREWYGDTQSVPEHQRPKLTAKPLSAHEFEVIRLRVRDSREVAVLAAAVAKVDCPLREAVLSLVRCVDRINCWIAEIEVPDGSAVGDPEAPDFSGLTCDALRAKRATLCLMAKRAHGEARGGDYEAATQTVLAGMDACFTPGMGP